MVGFAKMAFNFCVDCRAGEPPGRSFYVQRTDKRAEEHFGLPMCAGRRPMHLLTVSALENTLDTLHAPLDCERQPSKLQSENHGGSCLGHEMRQESCFLWSACMFDGPSPRRPEDRVDG